MFRNKATDLFRNPKAIARILHQMAEFKDELEKSPTIRLPRRPWPRQRQGPLHSETGRTGKPT